MECVEQLNFIKKSKNTLSKPPIIQSAFYTKISHKWFSLHRMDP